MTLAYLVLEMQQNTAAIQGTVRQAMLAEDRESLYQIVENPFLGQYIFGDGTVTELTADQEIQFRAYLTAFFKMRENHWLQYQNGVLDELTWRSYRTALLVTLSAEIPRLWWYEIVSREALTPGFVADINQQIDEASAVGR